MTNSKGILRDPDSARKKIEIRRIIPYSHKNYVSPVLPFWSILVTNSDYITPEAPTTTLPTRHHSSLLVTELTGTIEQETLLLRSVMRPKFLNYTE